MTAFFALIALAIASPADGPASFDGTWRTTYGPLVIAQKGDSISGKYNGAAISGKISKDVLTLEYKNGTANLTIDPNGHAFSGTFRTKNGGNGPWNGWRPDPEASKGAAANFSGLWLTDYGLMELKQEGEKVKGRYAIRGTTSLEGDVKGRHLEFRFQGLGSGPGWFDLSLDGQAMDGAGGSDGQPNWYAWKGRKSSEFVPHVALKAGQIVDGSTDGLLTYCVRAPEGYKPDDGKKWPTILILHGSNMNAKSYVGTLAAAWPDIAKDYILLGINGETPSNTSSDAPAFNYTYVSFVGRSTFQGFPGTDRESPGLVHEAMEELKKVYPIKHYFVGGHSQGGFLTYSLLMNFPESIAGAFPISCGLIFQCEPGAYADEAVKKAQRAVPLAIVHAKNDPVVPFSMGDYAFGLFEESNWPALRLFSDDRAAHMFGVLPVKAAVRWLEAQSSEDPVKLLDFAESRMKSNGYRDAIAATRRAKGMMLDAASKERVEKLNGEIDAKASPGAKDLLVKIQKNENAKWIDDFIKYRNEYEFADSASEMMKAFAELRSKQDEPAKVLMGEARQLFQQGKQDEGYAKVQEVVDKLYASSSYRMARQWLANRK